MTFFEVIIKMLKKFKKFWKLIINNKLNKNEILKIISKLNKQIIKSFLKVLLINQIDKILLNLNQNKFWKKKKLWSIFNSKKIKSFKFLKIKKFKSKKLKDKKVENKNNRKLLKNDN